MSGGQCFYCYAFSGRPEVEATDVVITYIVSICHCPAYMLFHLYSTYSYVSIYFSLDFDMPCNTTLGRIVEGLHGEVLP